MVDELYRKGVHVFRHETREIDGCGPLHVSGHASIDEYKDMINMTNPQFFIPIYGDFTAKRQHIEIAVEQGIPRKNTLNCDNGDVVALTADKMEIIGQVPHGIMLVDQTGAIVNNVVVKDRLMLAEEGLVAVVITVDRKTGALMTSPDIISRGFIYMRDSEELMNDFRTELRRAVNQRFKRIDLDRFKQELKDHVTHFLFENTGRAPIVIPVVNVISGGKGGNSSGGNGAGNNVSNGRGSNATSPPAEAVKTPEDLVAEQQQRFQEMRARLLSTDQPD
ncbi:MAG: ribonuclease J, partial [Candidatus Saccharimonadales bacterium]